MLSGLTERMRRWRLGLIIVAIAMLVGVGASTAHGALDASDTSALAQGDAEKCFVVGLVCALALASVVGFRRFPPVRSGRWIERIGDIGIRQPADVITAARDGVPPPTSARLCRFLT